MREVKKLSYVAATIIFVANLQAEVATVSDVTAEQVTHTRKVQVHYTTDGPGIATGRFYNDGEPIGAPGQIATFTGDINKYLDEAGTYSFTWNAGRDMPEEVFEQLTVEVKLWSPENPPDYCEVYLVEDHSGKYPVFWYDGENGAPLGATNVRYKSNHLLLRKIPSSQGNFVTLGSPTNEVSRNPARESQRPVRITKPFYIGVYPVTQCQWGQVSGISPAIFIYEADKDTRPVENISYYQTRESASYNKGNAEYSWPTNGHTVAPTSFMGRLRTRTGGLIEFDLPTEAQWEYACRAGSLGPLNNGDDPALLARYSTNGGLIPTGYTEANVPADLGGTARVGSYQPNAWGLYDMLGNVYEWCLDWYSDTTPEALPSISGDDPVGPEKGVSRVFRGGRWSDNASTCRCAFRSYVAPDIRANSYGFRVAAAAGLVSPTSPLPAQ